MINSYRSHYRDRSNGTFYLNHRPLHYLVRIGRHPQNAALRIRSFHGLLRFRIDPRRHQIHLRRGRASVTDGELPSGRMVTGEHLVVRSRILDSLEFAGSESAGIPGLHYLAELVELLPRGESRPRIRTSPKNPSHE